MSYARPALNAAAVDALEPRQMLSKTPIAINFNDEALWDTQFATAAAQAKTLGVQAVRLWLPVTDFSARPNAWDPVSPYGDVTAGVIPADEAHPDATPTVMTRAFQLKAMGFKVLVCVQPDDAAVPPSADAARAFVRHIMDGTQTPDSTVPLKDVIDQWEIGNEPDSGNYWAPSAVNKTNGLQSYVDDWLIPAATELKSNGDNEYVLSAGVSGDANDLYTITNELKAKGDLGLIDAIGFHPYGYVTADTDGIANSTAKAVKLANSLGKGLVATEWNIRGYGTYGTHDAAWAAAVDSEYKKVILPNYDAAYYFTLIDNWDGRGGSISARPAGLLQHDGSAPATPTSDVLTLRAYFNSPLVTHDPFYSVFKAWQYGTVSGVVTDKSGGTAPAATVYIDTNGNGKLDSGEPTATSNASTGKYTLTYSVRDVPTGTYAVRLVAGTGTSEVTGSVSASLTNLKTSTANFTVQNTNVPASTGQISGTLWDDTDGDGSWDGLEKATGIRTVFLDANHDGVLDAGEKTVNSDASGKFTFSGLAAGTYYVSRVFPPGWHLSNSLSPYVTVTVAAGGAVTGVNLGSAADAVPGSGGTGTGGTGSGTSGGTGAIDGTLFTTSSKTAAMRALSWTAYVDANNNGKLDAGETSRTTDQWGQFYLTGLTAGTYTVRLAVNAGWKLTTPATGYFSVKVKTGQTVVGKNFVLAKA